MISVPNQSAPRTAWQVNVRPVMISRNPGSSPSHVSPGVVLVGSARPVDLLAPKGLRVVATDVLSVLAVIAGIPLAVLAVGLPVVLAVQLVRWISQWG